MELALVIRHRIPVESLKSEFHPYLTLSDEPAIGEWYNVQVIATSEGWSVEAAILGSMLQVAGMGKFGPWMDRFAGADGAATRVFTEFMINEGVGKIIDTATEGTEILHIPARLTPSIDVTEEPWTEASVHFALEKDGRQGYRLDASWVNDYAAEVTVATASGGCFGRGYIEKTQSVGILPVEVAISPRRVTAAPGDLVTFTVMVDAVDPRIDVDATSGFLIHSDHGDGSHTIQVTVPAEDQLPVILTATSSSTGGLLANFNRPAPSAVAAITSTNSTESLHLSPRPLCIELDEVIQFSATVDNEPVQLADLTITVTNGSILQDGTFVSANNGYATVEARSKTDPELTDRVDFPVGMCEKGSFRATYNGDISVEFVGEASWGLGQVHTDGSYYVGFGFIPKKSAFEPTSGGLYFYVHDGLPTGMEGKTYPIDQAQMSLSLTFGGALYSGSVHDCTNGPSITITSVDYPRIRGTISMTCPGMRITNTSVDEISSFSLMMEFDARCEQGGTCEDWVP